MATVRLGLEYDGRGFAGWAAQPGLRTVEGALRDALRRVTRQEPRELRVAGRTDAGVSATGQVVSVLLDDADPRRLQAALNGTLPVDVAVRAVALAPDGFDARADAIGRAYEYRVLTGPRSPLRHHRALHVTAALDVQAMNAAAAATVGAHDFTAFTPSDTRHQFFRRTVTRCAWDRRGDELVLCIAADAFLRHMVRVIVGTMIEVGRGVRDVTSYARLLDGAVRAEAGATAAAYPLTLVGVDYPECG